MWADSIRVLRSWVVAGERCIFEEGQTLRWQGGRCGYRFRRRIYDRAWVLISESRFQAKPGTTNAVHEFRAIGDTVPRPTSSKIRALDWAARGRITLSD